MSESKRYHVGCGVSAIYAGKLKEGTAIWTSKSDVTEEAMYAVATWMMQNGKDWRFRTVDGTVYRLGIWRDDDGNE